VLNTEAKGTASLDFVCGEADEFPERLPF
jgi:hypothetical protein